MTDRTAQKIDKAHAAAAALINAGQAAKVRIKEANEALGRAYDAIRGQHHDQVVTEARAAHPGDDQESLNAYWKALYARDLPYGLHQVRAAKHQAAAETTGNWERIAALVELREAVKALPIVTREPKEPGPEELIKNRAMKSFAETIKEQRAKFDWAAEIMKSAKEVKPGILALPISVQPVYCQNEYGTSWVRCDWYLRGEKTAFNIIAAAADAEMQKRSA